MFKANRVGNRVDRNRTSARNSGSKLRNSGFVVASLQLPGHTKSHKNVVN